MESDGSIQHSWYESGRKDSDMGSKEVLKQGKSTATFCIWQLPLTALSWYLNFFFHFEVPKVSCEVILNGTETYWDRESTGQPSNWSAEWERDSLVTGLTSEAANIIFIPNGQCVTPKILCSVVNFKWTVCPFLQGKKQFVWLVPQPVYLLQVGCPALWHQNPVLFSVLASFCVL